MNNKPEAKFLNAFEVAIHQHFFAAILDLREKSEFIANHIPGAFHIDLGDPLPPQLQRIGSPSTPLILLLSEEAQFDTVAARLAEAGYTHIAGIMSGTLSDWEAIGLPLTSGDVENIQPQQLRALLELPDELRPMLLDVREPREFEAGNVPSAQLLPLEELSAHLDDLDRTQPIAVICETGCRSQAAAALLGQRGFTKVYDVLGGTLKWKEQGLPLERKEIVHATHSTDRFRHDRSVKC